MIENQLLTAHYQPMLSATGTGVIAYEGLIRGLKDGTPGLIPPYELFARAARENKVLELDRMCRGKVLEMFLPIHQKFPDLLLSMNFDASVLDDGVGGSGHLRRQVEALGVSPGNILIEIIESDVQSIEGLKRFIDEHREAGFLIALDDVGAGHSNLNRIPLLRPDLLKIDRYLISDLPTDFHKQEVFRSLVSLARKIGAVLLAEGVETEEEAQTALGMGADLLQGYYLSAAVEADSVGDPGLEVKWQPRLDALRLNHKDGELKKLKTKRSTLKRYEVMTREIEAELEKLPRSEFDGKLSDLARFFPLVECLYVLSEDGVQVTEAVFRPSGEKRRNLKLFKPTHRGSSHAHKDYCYMLLEAGLARSTFVTDPYLSMATGFRCVTLARVFRDAQLRRHLLCVDIDAEALERLRG